MTKIMLVGIGGFIGATLRYWISIFLQNLPHHDIFPFATLVVNTIGCFVIGMVYCFVESQTGKMIEIRLFLMVGILGSFTTYSTFSNETMILLQNQKWFMAIGNVCMHILLGLLAVVLGRIAITTLFVR